MNDLGTVPTGRRGPDPDLKGHYLGRLERLLRLRRDFEEHLNNLGVELRDRSIYATLRDCMENGAGRRAQSLMKMMRRVPPKSRLHPA